MLSKNHLKEISLLFKIIQNKKISKKDIKRGKKLLQ